MRFPLLVLTLAAEGAIASSWFGKAAYNKWHETELERWLSDHNVPFPTASDRKELIDLVNKNWEQYIVAPYNSWDIGQLQTYLTSQGKKAEKGAKATKDDLIKQVKATWTDTTETATESYNGVQNWIFDSWTDSQLKAFLDYNNIPSPAPRTRDSVLQVIRSNYQKVADKAGETAAYPGDWLYSSWSDSDLKAWLDERGIPVPQPGNRDKLIASIRRNSRLAANKASAAASSLSSSAAAAQQSLADDLLNTYDELQLKQWADKQGINIPQGSRKNELKALIRKHQAKLVGNNPSASAASAYGAATTSAGNAFAQVTDDLYDQGKQWYDWALHQVGAASAEARASLSSVSSAASSYASSLSIAADKAASSASKEAVKTSGDIAAAVNSARAAATKSASSASKVAAASVYSASRVASLSLASASLRARASATSVKGEL